MPSISRQKLSDNSDDFDRLWEIHETEAGSDRGRKRGVEVLNKSAVILVCAAWEAYCEDIVSEAISYIVADCSDFQLLPKRLKTRVADKLKSDGHEHAVWKLAGDGWRSEVQANATETIEELTGKWNTPKSEPINKLFLRALGIEDITKDWYWAGASVRNTTSRLDNFIVLRGEIAHRQKPQDSVRKADGTSFYNHVCSLADKIDASVGSLLQTVCNKSYW